MNHFILILFSSIFSLVSFSVFANNVTQSPSIDSSEAYQLVKNGKALLIDVREENEIKEGMAKPAIWFKLGDIESQGDKWKKFLQEVKAKPNQEIILYCRSGRRSEIAAQFFMKEGIKTYNMGGFDGWKKKGLPIRNGP